jgi:hypothetical protein
MVGNSPSMRELIRSQSLLSLAVLGSGEIWSGISGSPLVFFPLLGGIQAREGAIQALSRRASMLEMEMVLILAEGNAVMAVRAGLNVLVNRRKAATAANSKGANVKETKRGLATQLESQRRRNGTAICACSPKLS